MKFKYKDNEYRIVFWHDKSRRLSDHIGHDLTVMRKSTSGKPVVACMDCAAPDGAHCLQLLPISRKVKRSTHCAVQIKTVLGWVTVHEGSSKLNVKHGDVFNRRDGCSAALVSAIGEPSAARDAFNHQAWLSFFARRPQQLRILKIAGLVA